MTHPDNAAPAQRSQTALHRFALFTAACTLMLLVAGALVTSHDAGLAVPDWPLSYGSLLPPMVGGIFWEHGHRMVATFVGLLTIVLAAWIQRRDSRRWMRRVGWIALAAVVLQGLLGGLTVILFLPPLVSVAHAGLAQLFFCLTASIALFTSRWWQEFRPAETERAETGLRRAAVIAAAGIFIQLLLGAAFRHGVLNIIPHLVWAFVVVFLAGRVSRLVRKQHRKIAALRRGATLLSAIVGVQILVGLGTWWAVTATSTAPQPAPVMIWTTVLHLALGALAMATSVVLALCAFRVAPPEWEWLRTAEAAAIPEKAAI